MRTVWALLVVLAVARAVPLRAEEPQQPPPQQPPQQQPPQQQPPQQQPPQQQPTPQQQPQEETHSCLDASGEVVFQNDPCDTAPKKKAPAAPAAKSSRTAKPAKAAKPAPTPQAKAQPAAIPASLPAPGPAPRRSSPFVSKPIRPVIDPSVFTSDPRWGSPERTLKTFVGAMKGGDQALARACLAKDATDDLDRMRAAVDAFNGYVLEGEVGPYWSIRTLRPRMRPKWIFFTRAGDGTWRIAAL